MLFIKANKFSEVAHLIGLRSQIVRRSLRKIFSISDRWAMICARACKRHRCVRIKKGDIMPSVCLHMVKKYTQGLIRSKSMVG